MRIHGRISVYGEYLMDSMDAGLLLRSSQYLATRDDLHAPALPDYRPESDQVASLLRQQGFPVVPGLRGDIWQGYGLSSSTAAAFLYLRELHLEDLRTAVTDVDRVLHGFDPSGVDLESCIRQTDGIYGAGRWRDVTVEGPSHTLVMFPKERSKTLPEIRTLVRSAAATLVPLAEAMSRGVVNSGQLLLQAMFDYSTLLSRLNVYSSDTQRFVELGLANGIPTKGIGGLYDKAVLVLWPQSADEALKSQLLTGARELGAIRWRDDRSGIDLRDL